MKKYYLDKMNVKFLNVLGMVLLFCIIIGIKYLEYYIKEKYSGIATERFVGIVCGVFIGLLITAYVVFLGIILPRWIRSVCYTVSAEKIILESGVICKNTIYLKMSAVQYVAKVKTPFSRYTNLNFLLINSYGGRVIFKFLSCNDMEEIYRKIQRYIRERSGY